MHYCSAANFVLHYLKIKLYLFIVCLLLQAIDKDGSGFIDAGELGRMGGKMDNDKARALMTKLDKDGDGKINLEEFRTLFKQQ
jgi:Ca2+-binding EF-hand superfamily protein